MASGFDPGTGLGPRLRLVREERGLSVRELARRVGCSASLISQVERGVSVPSVGVLYSLGTVLRSSLDYLLFGADAVPSADAARSGAVPAGAVPAGIVAGASRSAGSASVPSQARSCVPDADVLAHGGSIVQRRDGRRVIDMASGVRWERLTPRSDSLADFLEVIYSPGGHSTDSRQPLRHDGHEYGMILRGTLRANVGFESYELGPGDSIAFDSSTPHEYWNTTDDFVHAVWVVVHPDAG